MANCAAFSRRNGRANHVHVSPPPARPVAPTGTTGQALGQARTPLGARLDNRKTAAVNAYRFPPSSPDPRRQQIARRLRERIGGNAEDFYRDACGLVEGTLILQAGYHVLGHCAREIESAVREVLVAMLIPADDRKTIAVEGGKSRDTHRREVDEIVRRLGLPADAPVELWQELADPDATGSKGLHAIAHREAHRHAPPIDDELRERWRTFESLLVVLLRELEARFTELLPKVRELARRSTPGKPGVSHLNELPNTYVLRAEFFANATPGWLGPLDEGGFFDEVPRPLLDEETGNVYIQRSPATGYLARLLPLPEHTENVLTIVERITIPHEYAERELLQSALGLDGESRRRYARHLVQFLRSQQSVYLIAIEGTDFAATLASTGDTAEAAAILEELLELRADPRMRGVDDEQLLHPTPVGRVNEHEYERTLEKGISALTHASPHLAFGLLLPLLESALALSERPVLVAKRADLSEMWMPNIASAGERYRRSQAGPLAKALRDAALATLDHDHDPARLDALVSALDTSGWTLCRRIALDLIDGRGDAAHVRARLLDAERMTRDRDLREFDALAEHRLGELTDDERRAFVVQVEAQIPRTAFPDGEAMSHEHAEALLRSWKDDLIRKVWAQLPADVRARYERAPSVAASTVPRPTPPARTPALDVNQLAALTDDQVVSHLKTWKPSESVFEGPSLDQQAGGLREAIIADPARFTAAAPLLKDLDPTYVRTMFDALRDLIEKDNTNAIVWEAVFDLAESAVAHEVKADEGMGFGRDPGWGWTRKAIADVLRTALSPRPRRIPYAQRNRVGPLIARLAEDPRAPAFTQDDERRDALMASLNTTRGSALQAAIEYIAWVADEEGGEMQRRAMEIAPEMYQVLDTHVDPVKDPSVAARGTFGYYLNVLLWYDERWLQTHRGDLFPAQPAAAAELTWQAYVVSQHVPSQRALELLADEYHAAVERISADQPDPRRQVDVDEALAQQLAHALIRGWIALDSADGLLAAFYAKAPSRIRAHVLVLLGQIIEATPPEILTVEHCERVQHLYEQRRAAAAQLDAADRRRELEAFGWIFATGRCDGDWMLRELLATLELTRSIQPDSRVMDKLAAAAASHSADAVRAVDLLTDPPKERWFVSASLEEIQTILRAGLADASSRVDARRVVNRLWADDLGAGIVQLLDEPSANT